MPIGFYKNLEWSILDSTHKQTLNKDITRPIMALQFDQTIYAIKGCLQQSRPIVRLPRQLVLVPARNGHRTKAKNHVQSPLTPFMPDSAFSKNSCIVFGHCAQISFAPFPLSFEILTRWKVDTKGENKCLMIYSCFCNKDR